MIRRTLWAILATFAILLKPVQAQAPLFGPNEGNNDACEVQVLTASAATATSKILYWDDGYTYEGIASLWGEIELNTGTAITAFTIEARLIGPKSSISSTSVLYDSTDYHTIAANAGDHIPAAGDMSAVNRYDFCVDLAGYDWFRKSRGIQVKFTVEGLAGAETVDIASWVDYSLPNKQ